MTDILPQNFPRIAAQSRRQMKDVELTALLLLLLEEGPRSYSQSDLDKAFSDRDTEWDRKAETEECFRSALQYIRAILATPKGDEVSGSRLRNQADFYSLVGAISSLHREQSLPNPDVAADRLIGFVTSVEDEALRNAREELAAYYEAARSASNDRGPRELRINQIKKVIKGG